MKKKFWIPIVVVVAAAVMATVLYNTSSFVSGRLKMTFSRQLADPAQTDSLGHPKAKNGKNVLVAYYSWGGNTREVSQRIHKEIGGDIYEIRTVKQYAEGYKACVEEAGKEINEDARPELSGTLPDLSSYDTVFIGYPVWWYAAPRPVMTFIDHYDFTGKEVVLYCTSGGTPLEETEQEIKDYPAMKGATFAKGLTANLPSDISPWLNEIGF